MLHTGRRDRVDATFVAACPIRVDRTSSQADKTASSSMNTNHAHPRCRYNSRASPTNLALNTIPPNHSSAYTNVAYDR